MDTWFRLRHLQSVNCRNVNISSQELHSQFIFFALSTTDQENLGYFYQSSKCDNILNPFWENVDLSYESIKRFSFLDNFVITFFLSKNNKNQIISEIKIHISGLIPISKLIHIPVNDDNQRFQFQFNNNWYSYDFSQFPIGIGSPIIEIPIKIKKKLCNIETILKFIFWISKGNQQSIETTFIKRKSIENHIYQYRNRMSRINQKQNRLIALKSQILLEKKVRKMKHNELEEVKKSLSLLSEKIDKLLDNKEKTELDIAKKSTNMKRYREIYLKISNEYMIRMYQLIHELSKIFPITPTEFSSSFIPGDGFVGRITIRSNDKLSICDLHLPNNDKQITINQDNSSFAALGMVCQLLNALSKIYDIPLRYPLILDDPKTAIRDCIIQIDDNERNFLLVKSAAASFRLQYAIYLLNLNIAAIRGYFSLSTKYTDRTLWNINTLIEGKNKAVESGSVDLGSSGGMPHSPQLNSNYSSTQNLNSPTFSVSPQPLSPLAVNGSQAQNP